MLVIDQYVDVAGVPGFLYGFRIFDAHRQRLFHHHVYAVARANLYYTPMIVGVGIDQHGLRMRFRDHPFKITEQLPAIEAILLSGL